MGYQNNIFGAGMHKGAAQERAKWIAALMDAQARADAQTRQNLIDGAAMFVGTVVGNLLLFAWDNRREQRLRDRPTQAA